MSEVDFSKLSEKENEKQEFKLSPQAIGSLMMALQKSLQEQSDIVPELQSWKIVNTNNGLVVLNPPTVKVDKEDA